MLIAGARFHRFLFRALKLGRVMEMDSSSVEQTKATRGIAGCAETPRDTEKK